MVDVAMAMRRLTSLQLLLLLAMVLPRYVKLSVVVTGCAPMSVDGAVGSFCDCSLNINRASFSVSSISAKMTISSAESRSVMSWPEASYFTPKVSA